MVSDILSENEADANKKVATVMLFSFILYTLIFILNVLNIFIIDKTIMLTSYIICSVLFLLPSLLNRICNTSNRALKYIYITTACLFTFFTTIFLSYHVVIIYCYPIILAGLYFSKRTTTLAIFETIIFVTLGQLAGFYLNLKPDRNFWTLHQLIYFKIIPNGLCLIALASLLRSLAIRTTELLKKQQNDDNQIIKLNHDMISGFATLVENRDENTGGHVKRTSMYVKLLAEELAKNPRYSDTINEEYIENLTNAAPMHDIGKIAIPDYILQKTGKLTPEEYEIMKRHASKGGEIIIRTFSNVKDEKYQSMAYEVARHHHERWNGRGYPDGLEGFSIPLPARIMAIADVFDAVSQKRCYREPLPLEECFDMIKQGRGIDFDPELVDIFFEIRPTIEQICIDFRDE